MTRGQKIFGFLAVIGVAGASALALPRSAPERPQDIPVAAHGEPVLVELFTSQGCSSCPPADKLAATLALQPGLVVISRPVTYWDRLGWKDTLARADNTSLQQAYAQRPLAGGNGVYTPQLVVNGRFGAVGSRQAEVSAGIARFGGAGKASIRVTPGSDAGFTVAISGTGSGVAELVLVAVTRHVSVAIGSGENGGRRLDFTNVVRSERRLAEWQGGPARLEISADKLTTKGADRHALVLRKPDGGEILAARWLS